ncbi:MAG: sodium-dependent bicarbonate transport family permease [Chitinophagaceae bacterium]|nr:sodium-dependent bicarbonate transport family permease [Chitinophagaceae bacterium]
MSFEVILTNLTNPTLLFFLFGIIAASLKSDLEIPQQSTKFISIYLLFSIGFKGGQELQHAEQGSEIFKAILFGTGIASIIPIYCFYILRKRLGVSNAGAIAASYGSVSAITFITGVSYLELHGQTFNSHMIAVMAMMELPAIVVAFVLISLYEEAAAKTQSMGSIIRHSLTNGSVLMLLGSLIIGLIADNKQAEGIKPFTTDIFKGFLALFLLEVGMVTAKRFSAFKTYGWYAFIFGVAMPLFNGSVVAYLSKFVVDQPGDRFIFAILAASASYIAVPAAMRLAAPKADPGLYIPMAIGVTFPFNITVGMPIYYSIVYHFI